MPSAHVRSQSKSKPSKKKDVSSSSEESSESESEEKPAPKANGKVSMTLPASEFVVERYAGQGLRHPSKSQACEGERQGQESTVVI